MLRERFEEENLTIMKESAFNMNCLLLTSTIYTPNSVARENKMPF